jgi:putative nucleotidyltransferase with HDIG domain
MSLWIGVLASGAIGLGTGFAVSGWTAGSLWVVLGLAVVAAVAERGRVRVSNNIEESISLLPTLLVAVLFGPLPSMIVAAASMMGQFGRPYLRWATYTCSRSVTGALTGLVAVEASHAASSLSRFAAIAIGTSAAALVAETLDVLFASFTLRLRHSGGALEALGTLAPLALSAVLIYAPLVAMLAFAYEQVSSWTLILFFIPALAAQRLFGLYQEQRLLSVRLERATWQFATSLVTALDDRDQYTAGHSAAVAIYARDIAARLGLPKHEQQLAHMCGLVHDIGKIGLPVGLLEKPGALTLAERRQMQEHSVKGERILAKVEDYAEIAKIVRHHHERVDGEGYPDGLVGDEIPLLSRIIAVADAYNAMTSDRPYRDAMPSRVARMRLAQGVEGQFDTSAVAAFEAILAGASEAYRLGSRGDFTLPEQDHYSAVHSLAGAA